MITVTFMSLVTSVKDYVEITHKLIEIEPLKNYTEFGAIFTYFIFSIGDFLKNFFSFSLFKNIWSLPIYIPDIASAMISEVSVLDGYFHNAFTFLETNVSTGTNSNLVFFEKFVIGLINSVFLILPTSTSHLITLRRFVMQGLEAGFIAGLGTIAGNFLWLASIILGWRFFIIPWLSLDIFRYLLGFVLLVKYIWDSSKERRMALEDLSKWKIFLLNFLLALTEQSCIYPFISNLSIGPDVSILEGFPVENYPQFLLVHGAYLLGILLGSFSLLQFTCWFWENPAFSMYLWITTKSSLKISTSSYYKILNFSFLYATMLCAIASIPYYGLDYTITNPIGLVPQDRILDQKQSQSNPDKLITETAFLGINPTDKNARIRDGVHARRERWKQRLIKYQAFDASMYDQGVYDFLTIEDLNYGFDRFWSRRKMRNHQIRFRLFPGPWMRSLKKQLNNPPNPSADSINKAASGPRVEFFRILFEQFYHPNFHDRASRQGSILHPEDRNKLKNTTSFGFGQNQNSSLFTNQLISTSTSKGVSNNPVLSLSEEGNTPPLANLNKTKQIKSGVIYSNSALRKYVRNVNTRINLKLVNTNQKKLTDKYSSNWIYSKRWKSLFAKLQPSTKTQNRKSYQLFRNVAKKVLVTTNTTSLKLTTLNQKLSSKERKLLYLHTMKKSNLDNLNPVMEYPLNVYLQKEQAFKRKLRYYGASTMRKLTVGNQAPYFKALMKRGFYYYKPSLRWKKTLYVASMRRGFRKKSRKQRILISPVASTEGVRFTGNLSTKMDVQQNKDVPLTGESPLVLNPTGQGNTLKTINITPPTHSYTVLGKRASRYRHQIYKDVLQHWYYTPFNRLLLKFDVDAFINRQPKTHFLTKNDERVLHIRRFLLSEHYDTLRWYTYMQHYKTMKTNIGGTKSFANRIYNQQFQGTFKKIRHLFAITPKQGDFYTLKFDQPLYNDNNLKDNVYFHEELVTDNYNKKDYLGVLPSMAAAPSKASSEGGRSTSTVDVNSALSQNISRPTGINYSQGEKLDIISQSNFLIANQFLQKNNTSVEATYPASPALSMSKYYASNNLSGTNQGIPVSFTQDKKNNLNNLNFVYNELFVKLIKECKKRIHDQTFLKNYISYRIEKREQLNQEHIKELNKRLEKLKSWLIIEAQQKQNNPVYLDSNTSSVPGLWSTEGKTSLMIEGNSLIDKKNLTTGVQKAVTDSLRQVIKDTPQDSNKGELELVLTKPTYNDLTTAYTLQKENTVFSKLNTINQLTNNITNKQNLIDPPMEHLARVLDQIVIINLQNTKKLLYNTINNFKPYLLNKTQLLQARTDKNLQWWRQKQRVTTKRKNSRKRDRFKKQIAVVNKKLKTLSEKVEKEKSNLYKTLYGNYEISDYLLSPSNTESFVSVRTASPLRDVGVDVNSTTLRKKTDNSVFNQGSQIKTSSNLYGGMEQLNSFAAFAQNKSQRETITIWQGFFSKKLRKKISSKGRRYRSLSLARYLTATRKPRFAGLNDLTKIDNITNLQGSFLTKEEKDQNIQLATKNKVSLDSSLKNSQIKKRTRHSWKKRARHQFSRNHYKYRKRHIHGNGKLRVMNKKIKKVKATTELRQWWWSSFLPRYLDNLKKSPITNYTDTTIPPDFKPLSNSDLNKDIALRQDVINTLNSTNEIASSKGDALPPSGWKYPEGVSTMARSASPLGDVEANLPFSANLGQNNPKDPPTKGSQLELNQTTTSVPFYAGWDDSLRKFVVTNRLLSRRDSGLTVNENIFFKAQEQSQTNASLKLAQEPKGQGFASNMVETPLGPSGVTQYYPSNMSSLGDVFTNTPIQGLNEGSFLYWQTDMPFNAYNIDQFITTNQSFYAPLGWRRFEFRHNILKTWINNASTSTSKYNLDALHAKTSINTHKYKTLIVSMKNLHTLKLKNQKQETIKTKKAAARRIKKRYKLLKQMPNQLMYSPTGPLLTEVLPSHYISVFDQQYRFPRNRYLKRNTLKTLKKTTLLALTDSYRVADSQGNLTTSGISKEFTLRKRVKPRRKYHRKRFIKKDGLIFPRRIKFTRPINTLEFSQSSSSLSVNQQDIEENLRWRPSTKTKQKRKETSRSKTKSNKRVKTNPLRLRQLRRREFQQILKPVQRYIPHNGGFAWPGDYLRLEVVDMPKLKTTNVKKTSLKQKINVQPVGIMPRKYLIEKHNILVLKKKLEKAYSSHQLSKVIKEYKILIENQK